jgi:hypothetical protein
MKHPDRNTATRLEDIPNIGKAIAKDLERIGVTHPKELVGQDPFALYGRLCEKKGVRVDPCVLDVFMAAVDFMEGGAAKPWWEYTGKRKKILGSPS